MAEIRQGKSRKKPSKLPATGIFTQVFATQGQVGPEVSQDFIEQ